jgi:ATP-dependent 26S proteasome regulatory subunit
MQESHSDFNIWERLNENLVYIKDYINQNLNKENSYNIGFSNSDLSPITDSSVVVSRSKEFIINNKKQILSFLSKLLGLSVSALVTYFLFKWLIKTLDPTNEDKVSSKQRADRIMKQVGIKNLDLNDYELCIASNIVLPHNIDCSWEDIGGLEHIINDLRETVIYPLKNFETSFTSGLDSSNQTANNIITRRSRLIQPPKGVLLFGVSFKLKLIYLILEFLNNLLNSRLVTRKQ